MKTEINIKEFPDILNHFLAIIGYKIIASRVNVLSEQLATNSLLEDYFAIKYWLELEFYNLLEYRRKYSKLPKRISSDKQYELYSFIAMICQIYESVNSLGKKRLKGMLLDSFKEDKGVLPIKLEVDVAAHLVNKGFDLNFHDLENGGGFDFEITNGNIRAEVECKCFSDDAGRKIHHREMVELCNRVKPALEQACKVKKGGHFINITVGTRLPTALSEVEKIAGSVSELIHSDRLGVFEYEGFNIEKKTFDLKGSPFNGNIGSNDAAMKVIHKYCADEFMKDNEQVFYYWNPKGVAYIVIVDSEKDSELIDRIYRDAKDACKKQLHKNSSGILIIQLIGINSTELRSIAESDNSKDGNPSGFQLIATRLMKSAKRIHLHTVAFMPEQSLFESSMTKSACTWGSNGPVYFFKNPEHPDYSNSELDIF